jgi:hypothetical protein
MKKNHKLRQSKYLGTEPLICVSRLLGLAPFSTKKTKRYGKEVGLQHSDVILTIVLNVLLLAGLFVTELCMMRLRIPGVPPIIRVMWFISALLFFCTCVAALILNVTTNRRNFWRIFQRISLIDSRLFHHNDREKLYNVRRSETIRQFTAVVFIVGIRFPSLAVSFRYFGILSGLLVILSMLCTIIFFCIIFQCIVLVLMLKMRYRHLRSTLSESLLTEDNSQDTALNLGSDLVFSPVSLMSHIDTRRLDMFKVRELRRIYGQLHDVFLLINKHYGMSILLAVIFLILDFIPLLYYVITQMKVIVNRYDLRLCIQVAGSLSLCISDLVMLIWLTACCHLVAEEMHGLVSCIHKIELCSNVTHGTVAELDIFLTEIKDNRAEFSACGFFTLNFPFLYQMFGVIITYIIVLFQLN